MTVEKIVDANNNITFASSSVTAVVIFLHGLGDTADGWADEMAKLAEEMPHIKFILPTATRIPVTLYGGEESTAWFDLSSVDHLTEDNAGSIEQTRNLALQLIDAEVARGIRYDRIVLGGFSQGAAASLFTGYQIPNALAGVMALSGFLPRANDFRPSPPTINVPLLMCHGKMDPVVRYQFGEQSVETMKTAGLTNVEFCSYPYLMHALGTKELVDMREWLQRILPSK